MLLDKKHIDILEGDLSLPAHREAFITLIDAYLSDEMGEKCGLDNDIADKILDGLQSTHCAFLLFARYDGLLVGMVVGFLVFSTFQGKRVVNIHDLIVLPQYRKNGIARKLLSAVEQKARAMDCCKITLEVRDDNFKAMALYRQYGFSAGEYPMSFWSKKL